MMRLILALSAIVLAALAAGCVPAGGGGGGDGIVDPRFEKAAGDDDCARGCNAFQACGFTIGGTSGAAAREAVHYRGAEESVVELCAVKCRQIEEEARYACAAEVAADGECRQQRMLNCFHVDA